MRRTLLIPFMLAAFLVNGTAPAQPDTPAALRQQIDRLQQQIDALRAELDALRESNTRLTSENEALRRALAEREPIAGGAENTGEDARAPRAPHSPAAGHGVPPLPAKAPMRFKASASPDALFIALVIEYAETFRDMPITDEASEKARGRAVLEWTKSVRATSRSRPTWLTRITDLGGPDDRNNRTARVTILDPISLEPIADPFRLTIPEKFAKRLADARPKNNRDGPAPLWKMHVEMKAMPVYQPGRLTPGPFDYPRFIGPFAGFGYAVEILSISPISPGDAAKEAAEKKKALAPVER